MNMHFDPDSFERISESISKIPKKCKLAVVDSFTLFMLLQLYVSGDRFAEHKTTLEALRPVFSKSKDKRKDKDIIYFLDVLQGAGMITFDLDGTDVNFKISEFQPIKPSKSGKERKIVVIWRSNRHIIEDYQSNVPFAFHCLLHSLQRSYSGIVFRIRISFKEIKKRLGISLDTLNKYKCVLEGDGYIFTIVSKARNTKDGIRQKCNEYYVYDYNHRKPPEKNQLARFRKQYHKNLRKEKTMSIKKKKTIPQEAISKVEHTINYANKDASYLFIGTVYSQALIKVLENLNLKKGIKIFEVYNKSEYDEFVNFCIEFKNRYIEGHLLVLYLKSKNKDYQEGLKVIIEKLHIPILVFVDSDGLSDSLVSRFKDIFKLPNEQIKAIEFIPPDKALTKKGQKSPYECPTLIKLGDYEKLSPSETKMDTAISLMSGDRSVYQEMLSELRPPATEIAYDTRLEALSLLKNRRYYVGGDKHD